MFKVANAKLVLYEYDQPFSWNKKPPVVAEARTNSAGEFSFDTIKQGHYLLEITAFQGEYYFDVEVTNKVKPTKWITIDTSPVEPDCSGGHEFEVESR